MTNRNIVAFASLWAQMTPEWTAKITNHDYLNDSRDDVAVVEVNSDGVTLRPRKPWTSQGRRYPTMTVIFNRITEDIEVEDRTVRLYHTPPPHTGKSRRLIKTFEFFPPKEH